MADLWRVTYMGEGVKPTAVGAFARHVTAYVAEDFARSVAGQQDWVVADPSGNEVGSKKKTPEPAKAAERPPEPSRGPGAEPPNKAGEKPPEPKAEKTEKTPAEKAEKK